MKCPKCNNEILQEDKFCNNCGYMLESKDLELLKANHRKIELVPVLIILFAVMVLSVGSFFGIKYFNRYNEAQAALNKIDKLIASNYYSEAYAETKTFKSKYNYGKFPSEADSRTKDLVKKSNDAYKECLQILSSDQTSNLSQTTSYFKAYEQAFDYSSNNSNINDLLKSISDYQSKVSELNKEEETEQTLSSNSDIIGTMNNYISELQTIHKYSDEAINQNNQQSKNELLSLWSKNYSEYNNIYFNFSNLYQSSLYSTIFTKDECDLLNKYVEDSLVPAQTLYKYDTSDLNTNSEVKSSLNEYKDIEAKTLSMLSSKKTVVDNFNSNYDNLQQQVETLYNKIKNTGSTGTGTSKM